MIDAVTPFQPLQPIAPVSATRKSVEPQDGTARKSAPAADDGDAFIRSGRGGGPAVVDPSASEPGGGEPVADDGRRGAPARRSPAGAGELTPDQQRVVTELRSRDLAVRAHEAAHQAAGGGLVGGASFSYQTGPDGRSYAVGGEVPVDLSTVSGDPQATIQKMARVRAAALAPADPSGQDLAVAAAAAAMAAQAQQDLIQLDLERSTAGRAGGAEAAGQPAASTATGAEGPAAGADRETPPVSARHRGALAAYAQASAGQASATGFAHSA